MFVLIWINFRDGIVVLHLNKLFLLGQYAFLFMGFARIVDLGTGINSQIIATSIHYRVELFAGFLVISLAIPLSYVLAKRYGLIGPAAADLIAVTVYNGIRCFFLYNKYKFQPFSMKSAWTIFLGLGGYVACELLFSSFRGLLWMIARSAFFLIIYAGGVLAFRLSEDVLPVWATIKKRLGFGNGWRK